MSKGLNITQLAESIGKTRQTIHNWIAAGLPRRPDKKFELPAVIAWMVERENQALGETALSASTDSPALERYRQARAESAELDLQVRRGELIDHAAVVEQWTSRVTELCSSLEYLIERLSVALPGKDEVEVRKIVSSEIWKFRDLFARSGKYCEANLQLYDENNKMKG